MQILKFLLVGVMLYGAEKPIRDWKEGIVIGIETGFVPTGARERGSVQADGSYSGSSEVEGRRTINFIVRGADGISYRLEPYAKGKAVYAIPYWGLATAARDAHKRGKPQVNVGNSIKYAISNMRGWILDTTGKEFDVRVVSAKLDSVRPQDR